MDVDVYKPFLNRLETAYLKDTYFVDSCFNFVSRFSDEANLDSARLRIFLEENNLIMDGCDEKRKYCDINFLKGIEMSDISSKVVKPFNKTIIQNREINYITHNDTWDTEEF